MKIHMVNPYRSLLFVPGVRLEVYAKAVETGADIICIDLEDAVADNIKDKVRNSTFALLAEIEKPDRIERWIRINSLRTTTGLADLLALADANTAPDGIMVPKISSPDEVRILRDLVSSKHPNLRFHPLIETNDGLQTVHEIAKASHKVGSLVFGGFDMSAELRVAPSWESLLYARQNLVHAAASADIDLLDMPNFNLDNLSELEEETVASANLGFTGKCAIHPKQVDTINGVFSPLAEDVERARDLVAKYEAQDKGFAVIDGVLMEKPVLRRLYRTIAIAKRIES